MKSSVIWDMLANISFLLLHYWYFRNYNGVAIYGLI